MNEGFLYSGLLIVVLDVLATLFLIILTTFSLIPEESIAQNYGAAVLFIIPGLLLVMLGLATTPSPYKKSDVEK